MTKTVFLEQFDRILIRTFASARIVEYMVKDEDIIFLRTLIPDKDTSKEKNQQ